LKAVSLENTKNGSRSGISLLLELEKSRKAYQKYEHISMDLLLSNTRVRNCKEHVDHLWAVLGLTHPKIRNLVKSSGWIDYSITGRTQFSYITFAKWRVENDE
jgi:hypothetical protein